MCRDAVKWTFWIAYRIICCIFKLLRSCLYCCCQCVCYPLYMVSKITGTVMGCFNSCLKKDERKQHHSHRHNADLKPGRLTRDSTGTAAIQEYIQHLPITTCPVIVQEHTIDIHTPVCPKKYPFYPTVTEGAYGYVRKHSPQLYNPNWRSKTDQMISYSAPPAGSDKEFKFEDDNSGHKLVRSYESLTEIPSVSGKGYRNILSGSNATASKNASPLVTSSGNLKFSIPETAGTSVTKSGLKNVVIHIENGSSLERKASAETQTGKKGQTDIEKVSHSKHVVNRGAKHLKSSIGNGSPRTTHAVIADRPESVEINIGNGSLVKPTASVTQVYIPTTANSKLLPSNPSITHTAKMPEIPLQPSVTVEDISTGYGEVETHKLSTAIFRSLNIPVQEADKDGSVSKQLLENVSHKKKGADADWPVPGTRSFPDLANRIIPKLRKRLMGVFEHDLRTTQTIDFLLDVRTLLGNEVQQQTGTKEDLFGPARQNVLVYGFPRFGKTTLCETLALDWSKAASGKGLQLDRTGIEQFEVCVYWRLKNEHGSDLEKIIVSHLYNLTFTSRSVPKDSFRVVLKDYLKSIVLIFDGYDKLDKERRYQFEMFLKRRLYLGNATVFLTSRPNEVEKQLSKLFCVQANIHGLTDDVRDQIQSAVEVSDHVWDSTVKPLYGCSPLISSLVLKALQDNPKPNSLFEFIEDILMRLVDGKLGTSVDRQQMSKNFGEFGAFVLERLKEGIYFFRNEDLLHLNTSEEMRIVFNEVLHRHSDPTKSLHVIAHHTLMQYFSVKFLRVKCSEYAFSKRTETVSKSCPLFDNCSGFSIVDPLVQGQSFLVGLVPDIVLQIRDNTKTYQMSHDINRREEIQEAFRPINLLLRIDQERLRVFGITKLNSKKAHRHFEDFVNMLDFSNATVVTSYFASRLDSKKYMKVIAVNGDNEDAMTAIISRHPNTKKDFLCEEFYLDLVASELNIVYPFVLSLFNKHLSKCTLKVCYDEVGDLVYDIFWDVLRCPQKLYTRISLGEGTFGRCSIVTWEIITSDKHAPKVLNVNTSTDGLSTSKIYSSADCAKLRRNKSIITDPVKAILSQDCKTSLIVHVKTRFAEKQNHTS